MRYHLTLPALLAGHSLAVGASSCRREPLDALLVWGDRPSGRAAQHLALSRCLPVWRCEDAFVRSLGLGPDCPPLGVVLDDLGIYYDVSSSSRLERLIATDHTPKELERAVQLQQLWCQERVSKYNAAAEAPAPERPFVLVVDQTAGDQSIAGGGATAASFSAMLQAALAEHPDCAVVVKIHPDVAAGRKRGHFSKQQLADPRVVVEASGGHPTALLERAESVYVVTSQLGFEALLWGIPVNCFGLPFFAGWGLTNDVLPAPERRAALPPRCLADLVAAALINYAVYIDPHSHQRCEVEQLVRSIGLQRLRMEADPPKAVAVGFTRWKRPVLQRFLPGSHLRFCRPGKAGTSPVPLVRWALGHQDLAQRWNGPVYQLEDGFIRSIGMGGKLQLLVVRTLKHLGIRAARPTLPISWVVDRQGIYFDATKPSDLETWLATANLDPAQLARAAAAPGAAVHHQVQPHCKSMDPPPRRAAGSAGDWPGGKRCLDSLRGCGCAHQPGAARGRPACRAGRCSDLQAPPRCAHRDSPFFQGGTGSLGCGRPSSEGGCHTTAIWPGGCRACAHLACGL